MIANKVLIFHGCGFFPFRRMIWSSFYLLVVYCEDESKKEELKLFLYNNCLDGFRKKHRINGAFFAAGCRIGLR